MGGHRSLRLLTAALVAALVALIALPQLAGAVLSGTNGRILFTSGRDVSDAEAKLHFWRVPASALDPAVSPALTPAAGVQHRHPTWSPDRTRIAYARGTPPADFDIFIQDLTAPPGALPVNITNTPAVSEDRPAWSPDGTKIAYETSGGDILLDTLPAGGPLNFTLSEALPAGKPAWTPDSQTIFYTSGPINPAGDASIVRKAANNAAGQPSGVTFGPTINEHQASVSPDGTKLCFTRGPFDGTTDVIVSLLNGGGQTILSDGNQRHGRRPTATTTAPGRRTASASPTPGAPSAWATSSSSAPTTASWSPAAARGDVGSASTATPTGPRTAARPASRAR